MVQNQNTSLQLLKEVTKTKGITMINNKFYYSTDTQLV